jgi:DNA-directed RNA polymerase beta' subunit
MIQNIDSISFGVYSAKQVLAVSVCEITSSKKNTEHGTVYDPRMGTTISGQMCETCGENAIDCPGHFGHIALAEPIPHPLFCKKIAAFLSCICFKCYRLLLQEDQIHIEGIDELKGEKRFGRVIEKIKKVDFCCRMTESGKVCGHDKPQIKFSPTDATFSTVYANMETLPLESDEIKHIFENITDDDVRMCGFDPEYMHPRNLIITNLMVLPPIDRPYVKTDDKVCDDDLTNQYIEIVKYNNTLIEKCDITESMRQRLIGSIRFRILTTFNNGLGRAKQSTNGRPIKGIKERLTGKDGQIRNNMMGKRCDQTARTVIGPGPNLKLGELGFPRVMADTLTIPVRVAIFNIKYLQSLVDDGKIKTVIKPDGVTVIDLKRYKRGTRILQGDEIHRAGEIIIVKDAKQHEIFPGDQLKRNGKMLLHTKPANRKYTIHIGWVVNRQLQDGDYVLLNRQPTLHKASMMAMRIKISDVKTLQMNLAITKPFNADFDGDEMNIHVPQSLEAQVELKYLSFSHWNLISPQHSKPNMAIVQDSLLGAYQMTNGPVKLSKDKFFNIVMKLNAPPWIESSSYIMPTEFILERMNQIRIVLKSIGRKAQCYNGHGLISMFLPPDFNYTKKNDQRDDQPDVCVRKGVMYAGVIDKSIVGSSHNSIHQLLYKEYNAETAVYFIDCIQFVTTEFLLVKGFSVGLGDCLIPEATRGKQQEIEDVIQKCYVEAEGIKKVTTHPNIREIRINATLNKAKDIGLRIAKDALAEDNNFISTVKSGSKGDFFNITQITGLLGQQNLKGKRVPCLLNNGRRSLPHYPYDITDMRSEYESRGFIDRGFLVGLNPRQFFFHAMSGREGICDTAMGTATSGYMQRRIVKLTEDIKIHNDGTVRDDTGRLYQFAYGGHGYDPTKFLKVEGGVDICNVDRLTDRLNMKYEDGCE